MSASHRVLLVGHGGHGKTTQTLTLAGPKLYYALDTNARDSLAPAENDPDWNVVTIDPDMDSMDLDPMSVSKGVVSKPSKHKPQFYLNWAEDFSNRVQQGEFQDLGRNGGWLIIDGISILSAELMLLQAWEQRHQQNLEVRMDYQLAGVKMRQVIYWICRQPCNVLCTARYRLIQDEMTRQVGTVLALPGSARVEGTYSFGWGLCCEVESQGNDKPPKFWLRTAQDEDHPALRVVASRMPDKKLPPARVPADLDFNKPLIEQGIGRWLNPRS